MLLRLGVADSLTTRTLAVLRRIGELEDDGVGAPNRVGSSAGALRIATSCGVGALSSSIRSSNRIPHHKQEQIIAALVEGCSIRSVERLTGVHRDTVCRFLVRTGDHCARLLDEHLTGVEPRMVQCDEVWTYCRKKDRRLTAEEKHDPAIGSQFVFVSFDPETKLAINHLVGKRTPENTNEFMLALRARITGRPKLVSDGFDPYVLAVFKAFGRQVDYAQLIKTFVGDGHLVAEGYSPAQKVLRCDPLLHQGYLDPWEISTSLVERQNATMRNFMKRLGCLTYGFSKKLDNLRAALDLHFCWYTSAATTGRSA